MISLSFQITLEVFFSQHISLLVIILQLPIPKTRLSSIPLLPSPYIPKLASRNSTDSNDLLCPFYNHSAQTTQKTHPLYWWENKFTVPLHSDGSYSIVACVFFAAEICLPSICLAKDVSSDFTISDGMSQYIWYSGRFGNQAIGYHYLIVSHYINFFK
jgi:hypothetical protein